MRLDEAGGFVFDVDGTLVHRAGAEVRLIPGARDVLERIHASGRPYVLFTNGSHVAPESIAAELREAGLPVGDEQMLTPLRSVQTYLARFAHGPSVLPFVTDAARRYLEAAGVRLVDGPNGDVPVDAVFVAQPGEVDFDELERAARVVVAGARLLTGSYVPAYAGADGPIFSRGAMLTAALAKATGARPVVVGKPSHAAVLELRTRLGIPSEETAVIGDDVSLDVPLGRLGGSLTVLVRSGISGALDVRRLPERRRPHLTLETVADMLDRL
ncbi:MAG TPA: HAD hydrolase-like protein [Gaiella sp.]